VPSKLAHRTDDARGDESFGLTKPGDFAEHRLRDRDGFVWLSSAFGLNGKPSAMRLCHNTPIGPFSALGSDFNPQNTSSIPACPVGPADRTGVVKILDCLDKEPKLIF
jgi:hypothetical protein